MLKRRSAAIKNDESLVGNQTGVKNREPRRSG